LNASITALGPAITTAFAPALAALTTAISAPAPSSSKKRRRVDEEEEEDDGLGAGGAETSG
jgi:hypothetical protein